MVKPTNVSWISLIVVSPQLYYNVLSSQQVWISSQDPTHRQVIIAITIPLIYPSLLTFHFSIFEIYYNQHVVIAHYKG